MGEVTCGKLVTFGYCFVWQSKCKTCPELQANEDHCFHASEINLRLTVPRMQSAEELHALKEEP